MFSLIQASDLGVALSESIKIENQQIQYVFDTSGGRLRLISVVDKQNGLETKLDTVYFHDGSHKSMLSLVDIKTEIIEESSLSESHQKMILAYESDQLSKRIELRLYDKSTALAIDAYYKLKTNNINQIDDWRLFSVQFQGYHHQYHMVSFSDRTDENNTLVEEKSWLGNKKESFQGNLVFVDDLETGSSFFILKESPYNTSQINYPGFDFEVEDDELAVVGVGFEETDLSADKWIRSYSVVFANYDGELDRLQKLREYQKCIRNPVQERGEMIMMNTWGDRNKDANIGEEFTKKEILACEKLGVTHFQLDDGWQEGLSKNSASTSGKKWEFWEQSDWQPNNTRFPNGFQVVVDFAKQHGVTLGLWFAPSSYQNYGRWEQDAQVLIGLYKTFGIKHFKIDGISIPTKEAEENLRQFFSTVLKETNNEVFFNLDASAGIRGGYHYLYEYGGNIFLENRYASWGNRYYP